MNRNEMRSVDWEKKDHNKVYEDALAISLQSSDVADVIKFLREKSWTDGEILGYLTRNLGLSLQAGREALNSCSELERP